MTPPPPPPPPPPEDDPPPPAPPFALGCTLDKLTAGILGGAWILPGRYVNLAPQAVVTASARPEAAGMINDESNNRTWATWNNGEQGGDRPLGDGHSEWLVLTWPSPVRLSGLSFLWTGFSAAEIETFNGPETESPLAAPADHWQKVRSIDKLEVWYPFQLGPNWVDFGKPLETRALRVRMTAGPKSNHPHLASHTQKNRKVWLGELAALGSLGDAKIETALPRPTAELPPPIAVRFKLPQAGLVTLVIEDAQGRRVRNLVSEAPFPAGDNVAWWDGSNDLARDNDAAKHGLYHIPAQFVAPGEYRVRGLWRKPLKLIYEMSVYSAGVPPWETADSTGCWNTNHTPPTSMAFVPGTRTANGQPLIFMGSYVAEGGHGLQWVGEDGKKIGGQGWVGGVWTGAPTLAVDLGEKAIANHLVYVGSVWEGELRLTAKNREFRDQPVLKVKLGEDPKDLAPEKRPKVLADFDGGDRQFVLAGLAAHNGLLVASLIRQNELWLVSAANGKQVGKLSVEDPRGLSFDRQGRLLVLSGKRLLRYPPIVPGEAKSPELVIEAGLEDPRHVTLDAEGQLYISDRGTAHQVKVFSATGKLVRSIGKPGLPQAGLYDPLHIHHPNGLALDSQSRLWLAEDDFHPKRVSVWTSGGELVRAYYGPGEYGGGGVLDSQDKAKFFYKGLEFQLDWKTRQHRLVRIFYRPNELLQAHFGPHSPDTPLYPAARPGERYFTSCYTSNPTNGAGAAFLWRDTPTAAKLVAGVGTAHDWAILRTPPFRERWPPGVDLSKEKERHNNPAVFAWTDTNGDEVPQPEEVQMTKAPSGGVTVMSDLSIVLSRLGDRAVRLLPTGFTPQGAPKYDLSSPQTLVEGAQGTPSSGGDQALANDEGWTLLANAPKPFSNHGPGGVFRGEAMWSYPAAWPGLHASHEAAVPDRPGMIIGNTRLLGGWIRPAGEGGSMFCVNGNMGNMYLLTADGLFVSTLFHDIRQRANWAMPTAEPGMEVTDVSLHDENFWPSITQTKDGQVYLVDGARTSLVRVDGLDSIRRIPEQPLKISVEDLAKARDWFTAAEISRQANAAQAPLDVALRKSPPTVDGQLEDWPAETRWAVIDRRGTRANFNSDSQPYSAEAAACIAGDRLYLSFRTAEKDLLKNSGETPNALFKTGGCLDLMLATDPEAPAGRGKPVAGDLRLLATMVGGKPRAILYRAVVPGTREPTAFSSPWRTITLDVVEDVTSQVQLGTDGKGKFELSIPLASLGWSPKARQTYRADLGLLRGNGFQTQQRVYWSNKATAITSDVPSEAELTPKLWGVWRIVE